MPAPSAALAAALHDLIRAELAATHALTVDQVAAFEADPPIAIGWAEEIARSKRARADLVIARERLALALDGMWASRGGE